MNWQLEKDHSLHVEITAHSPSVLKFWLHQSNLQQEAALDPVQSQLSFEVLYNTVQSVEFSLQV